MEDLFGEFEGSDDYTDRLEELAESLLREVASGMEVDPEENKQSTQSEEKTTELVGQAPENVETSGGVTIVFPNDTIEVSQECIEEVVVDEDFNLLHTSSPSYSYDSMSPYSIPDSSEELESKSHSYVHSDAGYESLGSPNEQAPILEDLWHESFSELFPSLA